MNGNVQQRKLSKSFLTSWSLSQFLEIILLLLTGVFAIVVHERLRTPINVPGHHGIEFMAIMLTARLTSKMKWASSISAIGIGIFLFFPVLGFRNPMMGFNYMLPCFVLDLGYQWSGNAKGKNYLLALIAGLGYMMIPLSRLLITLTTGYPYGSFLKHGMVLPFFTFFIFGFLGGIAATLIFGGVKKLLKKV